MSEQSGAPRSDLLVWIDLEMTGLDTQNDSIIEIATIVTDANLQIVAEGPVCAIWQPEAKLAAMDSWNTRQHTQATLCEAECGRADYFVLVVCVVQSNSN